MHDPYRSMYSKWDDSGNVPDYPAMATSDCGARTPSHHQTDETTEGDLATKRAVTRALWSLRTRDSYIAAVLRGF